MNSDDFETWHARPYFKGGNRILFETLTGPDLPCMEGGWLAFELEEGVSHEEAEALIQLLNRKVRFVTYTGPDKPEWKSTPGRGAMAENAERAVADWMERARHGR